MKGLHKKIGIGVLVSGLLIGGVGLPGGSISYASSNDFSLLSELSSIYSQLGLELSPQLVAFLSGDINGALNYDSEKLLKEVLPNVDDRYKDDVASIFRWGRSAVYSVIGIEIRGYKYSIPDGKKHWKSRSKQIKYDAFIEAAKARSKGNKNLFLKLGFSADRIYNIQIGKYKFVIAFF